MGGESDLFISLCSPLPPGNVWENLGLIRVCCELVVSRKRKSILALTQRPFGSGNSSPLRKEFQEKSNKIKQV